MKKRIVSFVLAAAMLLSLCVGLTPRVSAANGVTVKLHYERSDGNYSGWDVWFWPDGVSGSACAFAEENGEMVATFEVPAGKTSVGYIVRYGGDAWSSKDVGEDQYIDIAGVLSGTVHLYVKSGVKNSQWVPGEDVVMGVTVVAAKYRTGDGIVLVKMSSRLETAFDNDTFTVTGAEGKVPVTKVKEVDNYYYLTVGELNPFGSYTLTFDDTEFAIQMPDFYSDETFESQYTYTGDDLGAVYTAEKTTLRVWAPTAQDVTVNLYTNGDPAAQPEPVKQVPMTRDVNGTWVAELSGDQNGTYYTYLVNLGGKLTEACDPYARTTGVNGQRAMILDLDSTDPEGWDKDADPHAGQSITDAVIYELHVRDLSSDPGSGITNAGKYLGLIETGTKNSGGIPTGLDHIKDLGITHLHLLPVYDFGSVDETGAGSRFNWGYDPVNYNVPEGSYSTDPYNGEVRVREFKQMVKGLHDNGISVVMDVVYNHVYSAGSFCFNRIVPDYFSRPDSNGSGCGNDTASERAMVSKYIVDSVKYWADEYHIDGFRFDLVGLIDTQTINAIIEEVHKTHPSVIFYGEGWTMNTNVTKTGCTMTTQTNASKVPEFAFFNDTIRDLLKGSVFDKGTGFVSGAVGKEATLRDCFKGDVTWCRTPTQTINYASCHDNNTLFDRIVISTPGATREDQIRMNNLAAAIYMTSQGVPFLQAGEEMLRSKPNGDGTFNENSYNAGDAVNSLKWDDLNSEEYRNVYNYYKGLIAFRKAHPALRLTTAADVSSSVEEVGGLSANVVGFQIAGGINGETAESLYVVFNANGSAQTVTLPEGSWNVYINGEKAGTEVLETVSGTATVAPISALVLVREDSAAPAPTDPSRPSEPGESKTPMGVVAGIVAGIAAAIAAAAGAVTAIVRSKKKK